MLKINICCACHESNDTTAIKIGCGCLGYICDDCRYLQKVIAHEKCVKCGGKWGGPSIKEEQRAYDDYIDSQYNCCDCDILPQEELNYDIQLQEHMRNGSWDIDRKAQTFPDDQYPAGYEPDDWAEYPTPTEKE